MNSCYPYPMKNLLRKLAASLLLLPLPLMGQVVPNPPDSTTQYMVVAAYDVPLQTGTASGYRSYMIQTADCSSLVTHPDVTVWANGRQLELDTSWEGNSQWSFGIRVTPDTSRPGNMQTQLFFSEWEWTPSRGWNAGTSPVHPLVLSTQPMSAFPADPATYGTRLLLGTFCRDEYSPWAGSFFDMGISLPYVDGSGSFAFSNLLSRSTTVKFWITDLRTGAPGQSYYDATANVFILVGSENSPLLGDFNGSGTVDTLDIFDFLGHWFVGSVPADWNADSAVDVADIFTFITDWFTPSR